MEKLFEVIKIKEEDLKIIDKYMEAYSEEGELYSEFEIEEDSNLFSYTTTFSNGYRCDINVNSGQCNCYIDYLLFNPNGHCISSVVGDDSLRDNDLIEFISGGNHYSIKIEAVLPKKRSVEIPNQVSKKELKSKLEYVVSDNTKRCDEKYSNIEEIDGEEVRMSLLDSYMLDFSENEINNPMYQKQGYLTDFIERIFFDNCYDEDYEYKIERLENSVRVTVEYK